MELDDELSAPPNDDIEEQPTTSHSNTKLPSSSELRSYQEGNATFKSNTFKLQISELIPNILPKQSHITSIDSFLLNFHSFLTTIPNPDNQLLHPLDAADTLLKEDGIIVPYSLPIPTRESNWKVCFRKVEKVTLVGSYANKICVKGKDDLGWNIDLAIHMPNDIFQEKDYLNGRYFHKRAYYLAYIAKSIKNNNSYKDNIQLKYEYLSGDPRNVVLVLNPINNNDPTFQPKQHIQLRIHPVLDYTNPLNISHLSPSHSNIRLISQEQTATHIYNSSLLSHSVLTNHIIHSLSLLSSVPASRDAIALLRVWANQRGYSQNSLSRIVLGFDNIGIFWVALVSLVVFGERPLPKDATTLSSGRRKLGGLGKGLSSYQLFRAVLDFLSRHDFSKHPIFLKSDSENEKDHLYPPTSYTLPTFVDWTSRVNILSRVPLSSLNSLRHDAQISLQLLDSASTDPFTDLFLKDKRDLFARFDVVIRITSPHQHLTPSTPFHTPHSTLNHGSQSLSSLYTLSHILQKALSDRVKSFVLFWNGRSASVDVEGKGENENKNEGLELYIGIILDPSNAFKLVDRGPALSSSSSQPNSNSDPSSESAQFQNLWGPKAELRRFKDGRIEESVVWTVADNDERAGIVVRIVEFILGRHFSASTSLGKDDTITPYTTITSHQKNFDAQIRIAENLKAHLDLSSPSVGFRASLNAYDILIKQLKSLDSDINDPSKSKSKLPLSILNISPISTALRYTSVYVPLGVTVFPSPSSSSANSYPWGCIASRMTSPMEIIIEFERSARWPDDRGAIGKMKMAFLERIGSIFVDSFEGYVADVVILPNSEGGIDGDEEGRLEVRLEIRSKLGWVFLLDVYHEREGVLIERDVEELKKSSSKRAALVAKNHNSQLEEQQQMQIQKQQQQQKETPTYLRNLLHEYTRHYIHHPRHHRAISALSHRFVAYPGTVRLTKRWLSAHWLLRGHVSEEAVEIICAWVFLRVYRSISSSSVQGGEGEGENENENENEAVDKPGTPITKERGFACVVEFLKEWKWEGGLSVPLYSPRSSSSSQKEQQQLVTSAGSSSVWILTTEEDPSGRMWTSEGPGIVAARRVKALAKATWEGLRMLEGGAGSGGVGVNTLFTHPTDDYDFLLHIEKGLIYSDSDSRSRTKYTNIPNSTNHPNSNPNSSLNVIRPGFDPISQFYNDLKRIYKGILEFFCDVLNPSVIGAVWDPNLDENRAFRVLLGVNSMPVTGEKNKKKDLVTVNKQAILAEIKRMGLGIVSSVQVQKNT